MIFLRTGEPRSARGGPIQYFIEVVDRVFGPGVLGVDQLWTMPEWRESREHKKAKHCQPDQVPARVRALLISLAKECACEVA